MNIISDQKKKKRNMNVILVMLIFQRANFPFGLYHYSKTCHSLVHYTQTFKTKLNLQNETERVYLGRVPAVIWTSIKNIKFNIILYNYTDIFILFPYTCISILAHTYIDIRSPILYPKIPYSKKDIFHVGKAF